MKDLTSLSLWPTTYSTRQATAAQPHWHSEDVHGYVVEGEFHLHDTEGRNHTLFPGDKFILPAKTIHAEGEISAPVTLIIGISDPLGPDRFLLPREPSAL